MAAAGEWNPADNVGWESDAKMAMVMLMKAKWGFTRAWNDLLEPYLPLRSRGSCSGKFYELKRMMAQGWDTSFYRCGTQAERDSLVKKATAKLEHLCQRTVDRVADELGGKLLTKKNTPEHGWCY
mmetsp:Transcript_5078/g.10409  ORF Transcript_5078/g.10409 Transcript_5078/m.10409 type:complete len:125 (-) Transcript_5078:386-760(-)